MAIPLHVEHRGSGSPILFMHSFAGDASHWAAAMAHLERQFRVVAFDFSGHGRSPPAPGKYSIAAFASEIDAVAAKEQLDSFVLVGHSLGALIAAEYAGSNSARVKALVLVDAPPAPGAIPPDQLQKLHAAVDDDPFPIVEQFWDQQTFIDARAEVKSKLLAALHALPREAAAALTNASLDYDPRPALSRYSGPKFAIVTPRNDAALSLHNAVPGFRHTVVSGTGHWIHLDKPDEFDEALDGFLKTI
ncbi:MAG: alpha/beta fold hydrolase [Steroidobacteraceae bacterium]|nr:alpha/beta fold hydrolase [Steroidobacteraceae bacterium]